MKNKNHKNHHHITIHQRLERLAHHRTVLTVILSFMALGFIKYESQLFHVFHDLYNQGFGLMSSYTVHSPHHYEVTRMPVEYDNSLRSPSTGGQ